MYTVHVCVSPDLYVTAVVSKLYQDRVRVSHTVNDSDIYIVVNISSLSCQDDGFMECYLDGHRLDSVGRGRLRVDSEDTFLFF